MYSEFENQEFTIQNLTGKSVQGLVPARKAEVTEGTGIRAVNQFQTVNNNKSFLCL